MQDSYGRTIDYIRISVTDQCNLRCIYCMPEGCIQKVPKQMLNDDQILMLCRCFAQLGVSRVKITGGEPLLRPQGPRTYKRNKADSWDTQRYSYNERDFIEKVSSPVGKGRAYRSQYQY